ncbi:hypothetical protein BV22DRAFT_471926 [Leucogyrophana mollusca]|uniref:Uncharacterized protein n=1 Tax=Leucogyrophana mollusca TaxID=85980 RepID=A0ACB8BHC2_9AGAM|nr:hypothetical protein BV22DRAFT_471926 [Leucogyrophana mollusca]
MSGIAFPPGMRWTSGVQSPLTDRVSYFRCTWTLILFLCFTIPTERNEAITIHDDASLTGITPAHVLFSLELSSEKYHAALLRRNTNTGSGSRSFSCAEPLFCFRRSSPCPSSGKVPWTVTHLNFKDTRQ